MIKTYKYTSSGPRPKNQDYISFDRIEDQGILLCVADGVGGNQGGEIASKLAVEIFRNKFINENKLSLVSCAEIAHNEILKQANLDEKLYGMATTIVAIFIQDSKLYGINCGDSRAYILRDNGIKQLSKDHTEIAKLLELGKITLEDAVDYPRKNILESALGSHKKLLIEEFNFDLQKNDRIILISDGVYSVVGKSDFRDISINNSDLDKFSEKIIKLVELRKTNDNFSLVAVEI